MQQQNRQPARGERHRLEKQAASLEEFLAALTLDVRIAPFRPEQTTRVSQLTQRTNQMNFTTVRRTEGQVQALFTSGEAECLTVEVSDRFGSYGLVGVIIFTSAEQAHSVDTFLLSCRALGRGVEHRMLARLGELAIERGLGHVEAGFSPTARNRPALEFLSSVGAQYEAEVESDILFRFPARGLAPLGSPDDGRRQDALRLLHTLVSHQSRGRIATLRDRQPDLHVREAIDEALSALEPERGDKP